MFRESSVGRTSSTDHVGDSGETTPGPRHHGRDPETAPSPVDPVGVSNVLYRNSILGEWVQAVSPVGPNVLTDEPQMGVWLDHRGVTRGTGPTSNAPGVGSDRSDRPTPYTELGNPYGGTTVPPGRVFPERQIPTVTGSSTVTTV